MVLEHWSKVVVDVAHDPDAYATRLQGAQDSWCIGVGDRCGEVAITTPDGERKLVVEAGQVQLEKCGCPMQFEGAVGLLARREHVGMVGGIPQSFGEDR